LFAGALWALPHVREANNDKTGYAGAIDTRLRLGVVPAPEDREPAVRKVIEAAGAKVISFYFTTGEADFLLVSETNEAEAIIAALMAAAAAGTVSNVSTARAWTGAEFKVVAERAAKAAKAYRPPGKRK
jgi:uncharacterized protein with GYD domain